MKALKSFLMMFCVNIFFHLNMNGTVVTVTNIHAEFYSGQIFLYWNNPTSGPANYRYYVFRAKKSWVQSGEAASFTNSHYQCLGYVFYNSSSNIAYNQGYYNQTHTTLDKRYVLPSGTELSSTQGLFVATQEYANSFYYYVALMPIDYSCNTEASDMDKGAFGVYDLKTSDNKLLVNSSSVNVELPKPLYQFTINDLSGPLDFGENSDYMHIYTLFATNHYDPNYSGNASVSTYPELTSLGSIGFNLGIVTCNEACSCLEGETPISRPLEIYLHGKDGSFLDGGKRPIAEGAIRLNLDDWLPTPTDCGDNIPVYQSTSSWLGYADSYSPYKKDGNQDIPAEGNIIKGYTQMRIEYILDWLLAPDELYYGSGGSAHKFVPCIDENRIYMKGTSAGAHGCWIYAFSHPGVIAALELDIPGFVIMTTSSVISEGAKAMFGNPSGDALSTNLDDPYSTDPYSLLKIFNAILLLNDLNANDADIPFIKAINGTNDDVVGWPEKELYYNKINQIYAGGYYLWDTRSHTMVCDEENTEDESISWDSETFPFDILQFGLNKPFLAISNGSADDKAFDEPLDEIGTLHGNYTWSVSRDDDVFKAKIWCRDLNDVINYHTECESGDDEVVENVCVGDCGGEYWENIETADITLRRTQFPVGIQANQYIHWEWRKCGENSPTNKGTILYDPDELITIPNYPFYEHSDCYTLKVFYDSYNSSRSTEMVEANEFSLYPNPASNEIEISCIETNTEILLVDVTGRLISMDNSGENNSITIDASDLPPGIYFIICRAGDRTYTQKLVIER